MSICHFLLTAIIIPVTFILYIISMNLARRWQILFTGIHPFVGEIMVESAKDTSYNDYVLNLMYGSCQIGRRRMIVVSELRSAINASDINAQYDEKAKSLLSNKIILAHIMVKTVDEFLGMNPKDVVQYIEGDLFQQTIE